MARRKAQSNVPRESASKKISFSRLSFRRDWVAEHRNTTDILVVGVEQGEVVVKRADNEDDTAKLRPVRCSSDAVDAGTVHFHGVVKHTESTEAVVVVLDRDPNGGVVRRSDCLWTVVRHAILLVDRAGIEDIQLLMLGLLHPL